jgi:hypothetical protein
MIYVIYVRVLFCFHLFILVITNFFLRDAYVSDVDDLLSFLCIGEHEYKYKSDYRQFTQGLILIYLIIFMTLIIKSYRSESCVNIHANIVLMRVFLAFHSAWTYIIFSVIK